MRMGTCKLYVAGSLSGWPSRGDGNVQTLCGWLLVGLWGGSRQRFPKNVGALKVVVLLVDLFTDWTFFVLSCVTGLEAERSPHTMLICVFRRVYSFHRGVEGAFWFAGGRGGGWVGEDWRSSPSGHQKSAPKKDPERIRAVCRGPPPKRPNLVVDPGAKRPPQALPDRTIAGSSVTNW